MDSTAPLDQAMTDRDLAEVIARERRRLGGFIRRRVPDPADAEDILQDVFGELIESVRLLRPIEQVGAWLYQVARNRIIDRFRRRSIEAIALPAPLENEGALDALSELLPSPQAGPEAQYARRVLVEQLDAALEELPAEQREVFVAHELEGESFRELATRTGLSINTLLSRKRYAVLHLRERLQQIYREFELSEGNER
ncbi:MAG: sigma-70 family RNA polymerase sigma factor [Burkholderiaceae bacterium]|nr:sigma-70 family RNA polymerase sigma factor [Burkholderiaceae bacterium]